MKTLTGLWSNLARAYEIALLGDFTITVFYRRDEYGGAGDDYQKIKKYYKKGKFTSDGDMWIEIIKPKSYNADGYESLKDVHERVNAARNNTVPKRMGEASEELLKNAIQRLNYSIKDVETIKKVAAVISQLDGERDIQAHHIAEAIHYRIIGDDFIVAENSTLHFGKHISVQQDGLIYDEDIKSAIEYLQSL